LAKSQKHKAIMKQMKNRLAKRQQKANGK